MSFFSPPFVDEGLGNQDAGISPQLGSLLPNVVEYTGAGTYTFTAVVTGWHFLRICAGGGCGGRRDNGTDRNATGGGGGESAYEWVFLFAGEQIEIVLGAGGAIPGADSNGNPGGQSTATGPRGLSIIVNGGLGGLTSAAGFAAAAIDGGAGGTGGSGGDKHVDGQDGAGRGVSTIFSVSCGGVCALVTTPDPPPTNQTDAYGLFQDFYSLIDVIPPFTSSRDFLSGSGTYNGTYTAPSPGCGSAGMMFTQGTPGGDGWAVVLY
ncbi:MAG: hypothetical protein KDJ90_00345 [Nitratireductor sp.]|nr:hypothetical protein [Nitratireductor sp.]